jgi:hypothetical protein
VRRPIVWTAVVVTLMVGGLAPTGSGLYLGVQMLASFAAQGNIAGELTSNAARYLHVMPRSLGIQATLPLQRCS